MQSYSIVQPHAEFASQLTWQDQAHKEGQTLVEQAKLVPVAVPSEPPQRPYIC